MAVFIAYLKADLLVWYLMQFKAGKCFGKLIASIFCIISDIPISKSRSAGVVSASESSDSESDASGREGSSSDDETG